MANTSLVNSLCDGGEDADAGQCRNPQASQVLRWRPHTHSNCSLRIFTGGSESHGARERAGSRSCALGRRCKPGPATAVRGGSLHVLCSRKTRQREAHATLRRSTRMTLFVFVGHRGALAASRRRWCRDRASRHWGVTRIKRLRVSQRLSERRGCGECGTCWCV